MAGLLAWRNLAVSKVVHSTGRILWSLAARRLSDVNSPAKCLGPLLLPGVKGGSLMGLNDPAGDEPS